MGFSSDPEGIREKFTDFRGHYLFRRFAAAVAQHYGMPSSGLDVTTKLDVAIFFALTRFVNDPSGERTMRCLPVDKNDVPVLYVLEPFPERVQSDFARETPKWLPLTRPQRQEARFVHRGWEMSQTESARWLLAAFYLEPAGDFGHLPTVADLFPTEKEDIFAAFLSALQKTSLFEKLPELSRFVSFYRGVYADGA